MKSNFTTGKRVVGTLLFTEGSMSHKSVVVAGPPPKVAAATTVAEPSEQEIAIRAHELFLKRGGEAGHELEDWLQAERELKAQKKS
jgi:hypothetical protein